MAKHLGVCSQRYVRSAVTTPYWGMESLTSHGKVLGSLLSTLCAESGSVGVVVRRRVSSRHLAGPYIGLSWPRLSSFPPSVLNSTLSCVWSSPSKLIDFLTRDCHLGHEVVRTVGFCHFLFVSFIINSSIFLISPFLVKTVIDVLFFSMDNESLIRVLIHHLYWCFPLVLSLNIVYLAWPTPSEGWIIISLNIHFFPLLWGQYGRGERWGGGVHIVIYTYRHTTRLGARSESVLSRKWKI